MISNWFNQFKDSKDFIIEKVDWNENKRQTFSKTIACDHIVKKFLLLVSSILSYYLFDRIFSFVYPFIILKFLEINCQSFWHLKW
jgi:hypothetical protein